MYNKIQSKLPVGLQRPLSLRILQSDCNIVCYTFFFCDVLPCIPFYTRLGDTSRRTI